MNTVIKQRNNVRLKVFIKTNIRKSIRHFSMIEMKRNRVHLKSRKEKHAFDNKSMQDSSINPWH